MKKTVQRILCVLLFASLVVSSLFALSFVVLPRNNTREDGIRNYNASGILSEPKNTIDVLVLGDSESYRSIVPLQIWKEHGITSYVCGTGAQKLFLARDFLETALKTQSPKIVVLETNEIFRKFTRSEVITNRAENIFPVFRYHSNIKLKNLKNLFDFKIEYTENVYKKGYVFSTKYSSANTSEYSLESTELETIRPLNSDMVKKIKKLCDKSGAELILLSTPSTVNWNYMRHNSIDALAKELGVKYIDLNLMTKEVPINWKTDTKDKGDHLNHFGAVKVTAYLGKYFSSLGIFDDKRENPEYSLWDESYELFQKELEENGFEKKARRVERKQKKSAENKKSASSSKKTSGSK